MFGPISYCGHSTYRLFLISIVSLPGFTSRILYNAIVERTKRYVRPPPSGGGGSGSDDEFVAAEREVAAAEADVDVDEDSRAEVDQFYDNDDSRGPRDAGSAASEGGVADRPTNSTANAPLFSFRLVLPLWDLILKDP